MTDKKLIRILERDKVYVENLKRQNETLKKEIEILLRNNQTLTELIEVLENKILSLSGDIGKKYVYDYDKGGWIIDGSSDMNVMKLKENKLDIRKINLQLSEILRLMELHKVKHIKREQKINNSLGVEKIAIKKEKS